GQKHLERLRVAGALPPAPRFAVLRVGLPGRREGLVTGCGDAVIRGELGGAAYRETTISVELRRLVRVVAAPDSGSPLAPDTLLVRLFRDAADEEFALERGEIDVGVFLPGELSTRMRRDPRWRSFVRVPVGGVVACVTARADSIPVPVAALERMNEELLG